jgi:hypothetical protein
MEDLDYFKITWKAYVRKHCKNSLEKVLMQLMNKCCKSVDIGWIIEDAKNLVDVWLFFEKHFDRQTSIVDFVPAPQTRKRVKNKFWKCC